MKQAEASRSPVQPRPAPQPQPRPQTQSKPQPKQDPRPAPQKKTQPRHDPEKARRIELEKRRLAEERKRAEAEKKKREEKERIERDRLAAQKRVERREKTEEMIGRISSLRETYKGTLKNAGAYFLIFLCVLLIICTVSATVFLLSLLNFGEKPETPKAVSFSTEGKVKKFNYEDIVRDGVYYIRFSDVGNRKER